MTVKTKNQEDSEGVVNISDLTSDNKQFDNTEVQFMNDLGYNFFFTNNKGESFAAKNKIQALKVIDENNYEVHHQGNTPNEQERPCQSTII